MTDASATSNLSTLVAHLRQAHEDHDGNWSELGQAADEIAQLHSERASWRAHQAEVKRLRAALDRIVTNTVHDPATVARNALAGVSLESPTYCDHGFYLGNCQSAGCTHNLGLQRTVLKPYTYEDHVRATIRETEGEAARLIRGVHETKQITLKDIYYAMQPDFGRQSEATIWGISRELYEKLEQQMLESFSGETGLKP